ncbi:MAG: RNA methyltransferase [Candidatus Micrarchaeia archaeon]
MGKPKNAGPARRDARQPPAPGPSVRVVLVEPEYSINLGSVCRAMANFGFSDLAIVNPKCPIGFTAKKYAKHAKHLLEGATLAKSLEHAVSGCDFVVGTTGVLRRHKATLRDPLPLQEFAQNMPKGKLAILFGREGIGLMRHEIDKCDVLVRVESSLDYPIMNLSHAVAVFLYSVSSHASPHFEIAPKGEREQMGVFFDSIAASCGKELRNPARVSIAFRRVMARARVTKIEAASMLSVLRLASQKLSGQPGKKRGRQSKVNKLPKP